jgi:hypothetical protein
MTLITPVNPMKVSWIQIVSTSKSLSKGCRSTQNRAIDHPCHGSRALIRATHFPYKTSGDELDLSGKIIRDADLAQALNPVWVQQVVIGLAREWRAEPLDVLKMQPSFFDRLRFNTSWARELFSRELVAAKVAEAEALLRLLEG